MTTHIDVGYSRQVAYVMGIQPTTLILCGAGDGETIRDGRVDIQLTGTWPAACDCDACQKIARIMYDYDCTPEQARRRYQRQMQTGTMGAGVAR